MIAISNTSMLKTGMYIYLSVKKGDIFSSLITCNKFIRNICLNYDMLSLTHVGFGKASFGKLHLCCFYETLLNC